MLANAYGCAHVIHSWNSGIPVPVYDMFVRVLTYSATNITAATILELEPGQEVVLIGSLYKEQELKPSIMDEYAKAKGIGD